MNRVILAAFGMAFLINPAISADLITPDLKLTPGVANNPPTPLKELCTPGHTKLVRNVSDITKHKVFQEYGLDIHAVNRGSYEVDHSISLELDGSNDIKNLWPESYLTPLNAHNKDVLENALHRLVCSGKLPLIEAQNMISKDWVSAYKIYVLHGKSSVTKD